MAPTDHLKAATLFDASHVTAVVTGGGTGIGLMITRALEANGATVYITGRRREVLEEAAKTYTTGAGRIFAAPADISSKEDVIRLAKELEEKEPNGITLLVNNAGIARDDDIKFATQGMPDMTDAAAVSAHFLQSHESSWADTFKTNVTAPYWMSIALLPLLAKSKKSNPEATPLVICVTSVAGSLKSTSGGQFSYAASKAASTHLGRMLATTFKDTGVRVNTIAPGVYPSEMNPIKPSDGKAESSVNLANPCGRVGADSDIGGTVVFLAGKAGSYFTGQILYPDGGIQLVNPGIAN